MTDSDGQMLMTEDHQDIEEDVSDFPTSGPRTL